MGECEWSFEWFVFLWPCDRLVQGVPCLLHCGCWRKAAAPWDSKRRMGNGKWISQMYFIVIFASRYLLLSRLFPFLFSGTRVCPSLLSSVFGRDQTEKPVSVAWWALSASRLWAPSPHSNSGTISQSTKPSACPSLPPPPLPAETTDPLQHLHCTAGQTVV